MCQNGTLEGLRYSTLNPLFPPPFPLRAPTVPAPSPLPTRPMTLSVPFWHSSRCPKHLKAGGGCGVSGKAI